MVLTKNGIEESGTHTELMDKHGIYYNMYMVSRRDEI
jgi:ATP-binding cassette subfamily B protein